MNYSIVHNLYEALNIVLSTYFIFFKIFLVFIYFWERDKQSVGREGREREGETENQSEASSRLWAVSTEPDAELELTDCEIMTWAEVRRLTDWATRAPPTCHF